MNDVIVRVAGKVCNSPQQLVETVRAQLPGATVDIKLVREGKAQTVKVQLNRISVRQRIESAIKAIPRVTNPAESKRVEELEKRLKSLEKKLEGLLNGDKQGKQGTRKKSKSSKNTDE